MYGISVCFCHARPELTIIIRALGLVCLHSDRRLVLSDGNSERAACGQTDERQGHNTWHHRQDIQGRVAFRALPADTQDFFRVTFRAVRLDSPTETQRSLDATDFYSLFVCVF